MTGLTLSGGILLALTAVGLSLHTPGSGIVGTPQANVELVIILCVSAVVYLAAVLLVLYRTVPRRGIWIVLLVAVALRVPLILSPAFLSSDINRYVWDGRVQAAGINPYRYIPKDPALASLRDTAIFPHINRADYATTIYPPGAQAIFAVVGWIWSNATGIKLAMAGFEALAVFCLWRLLAAASLPAERVLIYAWNPLTVWAFAGNGHIDAAVVGFVSLALLLRVRRRDGWAGVALGLAVLTKFLPAVVAPVLWRRRGGWRLTLAATAVVAGFYALYSGVGWRVFGFLGGYGAEEGLNDGSGIWLLNVIRQAVTLPAAAGPVYLAGLAATLAVLGGWFAFIRRPDGAVALCGAAGTMMAVLTAGLGPPYPWYFAWLAVPATVSPNPAVLWLATVPVSMYLEGYRESLAWQSAIYGPAVLLAVAGVFYPNRKPVEGTI